VNTFRVQLFSDNHPSLFLVDSDIWVAG
jgi:hypothetical protein